MTVKINLSRCTTRVDGGSKMPLTDAQPRVSEEQTAGASTVTTTMSAQDGEVWEITPDVDIWAAFGATPDPAVTTARRFLAAGIPRNFGATAGDKLGIKAA